MQVELLKEQKKRTEIDTQRLMTEQMTAVFDNIGDSKSNQELLKALKEFHKFTLDLDRKLPSGHFFEDDSEYYFHVALEVNNSIDKILSFCNKFLEDYSHLYISDSLPKKLTELIYKLKNIEHDQQTIVSISGQSFDDAFDETASEMIDVWSELFDILQEMRDRNDDFLKIKTIFLNKIKIAK
ncbi:hypothetical protein [Lutibacter oceani]|nr:hypothetical protein [Lutibacter oceani]